MSLIPVLLQALAVHPAVDSSALRHADGRMPPTVVAVRIQRPPALDGRLDDEAWRAAPPAGNNVLLVEFSYWLSLCLVYWPRPHERASMQLATRRVYTGRVLSLDVDTVRFPDGSSGELEIIRHPGAAAVVPVVSHPAGTDPVLLMLRQYRYAAGGPLWEIPAGRLEHAEAPDACARRELREEAGVEAGRLDRMTTIWTTPGFTDEAIHLFWATDLKPAAHAREPDEFIDVVPKPLSEVLKGIRDGEIRDAKTIAAILYMAGFILGME